MLKDSANLLGSVWEHRFELSETLQVISHSPHKYNKAKAQLRVSIKTNKESWSDCYSLEHLNKMYVRVK